MSSLMWVYFRLYDCSYEYGDASIPKAGPSLINKHRIKSWFNRVPVPGLFWVLETGRYHQEEGNQCPYWLLFGLYGSKNISMLSQLTTELHVFTRICWNWIAIDRQKMGAYFRDGSFGNRSWEHVQSHARYIKDIASKSFSASTYPLVMSK